MPLDQSIKKVLVIGSGPIVIGQAAEFDYAGTQACRALREDNIEIVLVNSNPATIMTDNAMADMIYIEPLTLTTVKRIIEKEKPDCILSTLGGQTGLTLSMQLAKEGFLERHNVRLLGASPETIDKAEDRKLFKETMLSIGQPCVPSVVANDVETAVDFAEREGYPVVIRPAFTLGGSGGGIVHDPEQLLDVTSNGLALSPITQVLVEKGISGWKEIEFEVMRDSAGNAITVCSMENFDPVGIHTGDSIVIAPSVTLANKEFNMLRDAALDIVNALEVQGGCNCQFALHPESFEYAVIEVNPRVSRSSALASKATGYPIAKVATKVALGYTLDEIINTVTGQTYAAFEPALDYVAVKFPKWPFDKFVYAHRELGTQMKATGEVMAIADTFETALMKAVRGVEIGLDSLRMPEMAEFSDEQLCREMKAATDRRLFAVYEAIVRGISVAEINGITKIDNWFLNKLNDLCRYEENIKAGGLCENSYIQGKKLGFTDNVLERLSGTKTEPFKHSVKSSYRVADTCAGEYKAQTPYFYSAYDTPESGVENEAQECIEKSRSDGSKKETILVLGSGPIRIGQGIEFDYASVHCIRTLKEMGYEVAIVNNNPETVSTDFDTADRLYFEPLTPEDVMRVIDMEKPKGVVVAFGGGTAIKLAKFLHENNVRIIGTSFDGIDIAEDRERFDALLNSLNIKRPRGVSVLTMDEAVKAAAELSYPVLLRPSYVLGGQNMIIAFDENDVREYMQIILQNNNGSPVLIDQYMYGTEIEVDAICDTSGNDENSEDAGEILIPGIMEHIERTGVHSGDSISVYPAVNMDDSFAQTVYETTKKLCLAVKAVGLVNIQYIYKNGELFIIEMNPRASRTVPYLSKVTGVPMCDLATKVSLGMKLKDLGYNGGIHKHSRFTAVKVPVFSFEKLTDVDTHLGPEMKSTGEVMGIGKNLEEALYKGIVAAGYKMLKKGGVFLTVRDRDKSEIADIAHKFKRLGFDLYSTKGTAAALKKAGFRVSAVNKISENAQHNTRMLLQSGKISYILSTSAGGRNPAMDDVKIRRIACQLGIPCLTSIDTANALADSLISRYSEINTELVNINDMRGEKHRLPFTKMQGTGNDYIYIDCNKLDYKIHSPESLSVYLSDRHYGVGGDGVVLIYPPDETDKKNDVDAVMRMFNLDGSEGTMCGNAVRCVAKYLYDHGIVPKTKMRIQTMSGVKSLEVFTQNNLVIRVMANMGEVVLEPEKIPVDLKENPIINHPVKIDGETYNITCVSMGNPHCVVFCDDVDNFDVPGKGAKFESHSLFPERVNAEFVKVVDENTLKMRVYERGSGETMSCGTGACAAVAAAVLNGYCKKGEDVQVILPGGELTINYSGKNVFMTGDAKKIYEGVVEI